MPILTRLASHPRRQIKPALNSGSDRLGDTQITPPRQVALSRKGIPSLNVIYGLLAGDRSQ